MCQQYSFFLEFTSEKTMIRSDIIITRGSVPQQRVAGVCSLLVLCCLAMYIVDFDPCCRLSCRCCPGNSVHGRAHCGIANAQWGKQPLNCCMCLRIRIVIVYQLLHYGKRAIQKTRQLKASYACQLLENIPLSFTHVCIIIMYSGSSQKLLK